MPVPVREFGIAKNIFLVKGRAVDKHMHGPEFLQYCVGQTIYLANVGKVGLENLGFLPGDAFGLLREALSLFPGTVIMDSELRSALSHRHGNGASDALGGAGDE